MVHWNTTNSWGPSSIGLNWPQKSEPADGSVQPAPMQQVCRRSSVGARRKHLEYAFDEPKMARARPSNHVSAQPSPSDPHPDRPYPPRLLPCCGSSRSAVFASGRRPGRRPNGAVARAAFGTAFGAARRCAAASRARTPALSRPCLRLTDRPCARSVLTGTYTRVAAPADGVAPTARIPAVVAAAAATAADLSTARRRRFCQVRDACKKALRYVRVSCLRGHCVAGCRRRCRRAAQTSRPRRPRLTPPRLPRCRRSQRRRSAATACPSGQPRRPPDRPELAATGDRRPRSRSARVRATAVVHAVCATPTRRLPGPQRPPTDWKIAAKCRFIILHVM